MEYYALIEPLVRDKYWSSQYTEGIKQEISRAKGSYKEITFDDLEAIRAAGLRGHTRSVVLCNCISLNWISDCLARMESMGLHPLLLTPIGRSNPAFVSSISFDFYGVFYNLCHYLNETGHGHIALFGLNPSSANDVVKQAAFSRYYEAAGGDGGRHIFWNKGAMEDCCAAFYREIQSYNAVICANDILAVGLIRFLKQRGVRVPEDLYIAAMGNTSLSELISPRITVAKFDCYAIGQHAARLYRFLSKNPHMSSVTANVSGQIIARESTGGVPPVFTAPKPVEKSAYINFYADDDVRNIFSLEELFQRSDELDRHIIHGLLCERSYPDLAASLFVSESTVKYRVRKMIEAAGCRTKEELLSLLGAYIDF
ncbi:MAG: substrate-binding domain-containing protein [Clostridiales bacterium]|nr:substrate-binding domain-containing protein [Clostridiales bacterium]